MNCIAGTDELVAAHSCDVQHCSDQSHNSKKEAAKNTITTTFRSSAFYVGNSKIMVQAVFIIVSCYLHVPNSFGIVPTHNNIISYSIFIAFDKWKIVKMRLLKYVASLLRIENFFPVA